MRDGGTWGVPASGLLFQKSGATLILIGRMPHDPKMPLTAAQLYAEQESIYQATVAHFKAAGVTVIDRSESQTKH
jgi:hypothetical protein